MNSKKLIPLITRYSGLTSIALLIYFLLMKLLHLATVVELRFLNFIILFLGIRFFLLRLKTENNDSVRYLQSLAYGFIVSVFTSALFSFFMLLYLSFIDHSLLESLQLNQPFGEYLTPGASALVLILEGTSSGAIISFSLVQFMSRGSKQKQSD
ncbi:MAG: DUF4199 domain-containing protein [Bacteroidia bacterium]|nr:DUF4199 domain-containing protein [Bacteroidia bacterium]